MRAIIFPDLEAGKNNFTYPEEMLALVRLLEFEKATLNVDYMTLEKLWYAFSETRCAVFLTVDTETFAGFKEWVRDISCSKAERMDYNGSIHEKPYRPWEDG